MTGLPITYPYEARAARDVAAAVRHQWDVTLDEGGLDAPAEVVSATVTFDESWAPHVQASLTCRLPDAATLAVIDARTGARLSIRAGYTYPDREGPAFGPQDVWPLASLGITRRSVRRPQGDLIITAMSDEVLAQEALWHADFAPPTWAITDAVGAVSDLIHTATGRFPYIDADVIGTGANPDGSDWDPASYLPQDPGAGATSLWSLIESVADTWGLWVYDSGGINYDAGTDNGWRVRRRPTGAGTAVAQLRTGPIGNLTDTESVVSREDGWANAVHLIHDWEGGDGARLRLTTRSYIASGPMSVASAGYHAIAVRRTAPINQVNIRAACNSLVRRTVTRGRSYTLTAPAMYWIRPGMPVTVQLPTGGQERHIVQSVTFTYPQGVMDLTTRLPESVTIQGAD